MLIRAKFMDINSVVKPNIVCRDTRHVVKYFSMTYKMKYHGILVHCYVYIFLLLFLHSVCFLIKYLPYSHTLFAIIAKLFLLLPEYRLLSKCPKLFLQNSLKPI